MKTASPRRRPLSFAGMPTTEDSSYPAASMRSAHSAADRQGVHELWSSFRQQRSQSSLALSDTSMDFDMERDLEIGINSPGALSSEFSQSPGKSYQQLGQDPDSVQLFINHQLSRQHLHNLPEEIIEASDGPLSEASLSERSDSIRQPSIMLSQLSISQQQQQQRQQQQNQQQEGWTQPELTRRSSAGSNHSLSPADGSAGPHRRPMRRAIAGAAVSSNSLSPRSAQVRTSAGSSSANPLISAISLARRRSPVQGNAGVVAPSVNATIAQGEPSSKMYDGSFDRLGGTSYHAMPPPSPLPDAWNLNSQQAAALFHHQAMQRGDSNETAVSSSQPNTSGLDSSYERGQASATYDSSMFDQSAGMLQRPGSGVVTPLSSPSRSSYELSSVMKDRMSAMDSTSHSVQAEASSRATTWPRARPMSMMAMSTMPLTGSEASEASSQRNSMQLDATEFGVGVTRRSLSALGRHQDIETSSLSRPIAGSSRMSDIGPRPRARAGTVSSSQMRRNDRPADRYDQVRAALDTLQVYMNQTQSASSRSQRRSEGTSQGSSASPLHSRSASHTGSENPGRTLRHPPRGPLPPRGQGFANTAPPPNKEQAAHEERIRVLQDVSERISDLKQRSEDYLRRRGSDD